jgi:F0F1-type ATP synthase assembly protein I
MLLYLTRLLISAAIIVAVTEVAKTNAAMGGLIKSLPLVSLVAILWLWHDTHDADKIAELSISTVWFVLPSLPFFVILWTMLKRGVSFPAAFLSSLALMIGCYVLTFVTLRRLGVQI